MIFQACVTNPQAVYGRSIVVYLDSLTLSMGGVREAPMLGTAPDTYASSVIHKFWEVEVDVKEDRNCVRYRIYCEHTLDCFRSLL